MKRILLLILAFLVCLGLAMRGNAEEEGKARALLPIKTEGTLVMFTTDGLYCVLYVNENGMAAGAGSVHCTPQTSPTQGFEILRVVKTEGSE